MRAIAASEPAAIRSPQAVRPWQHVLEPLAGYLLLAERLHTEGTTFAEAWNFGPHDEDARPIQRLIQRLTAAWQAGGGQGTGSSTPGRNPTAPYLKLDCAKARSQLGWQPR
ncbi:MAG: hypothetical protein IPN92_16245 [Chromatiaceae bacterium]|nr:hypothetical protein [Chromatiaceae bacterium]